MNKIKLKPTNRKKFVYFIAFTEPKTKISRYCYSLSGADALRFTTYNKGTELLPGTKIVRLELSMVNTYRNMYGGNYPSFDTAIDLGAEDAIERD